MRKKTITTLATLATAAVILIGSYVSKDVSNKLPEDVSSQYSATQSNATIHSSEQSAAKQSSPTTSTEQLEKMTFPESIVKIGKAGIAPFGYINASVTKVIDGDTFHIKYDNEDYKVRMLDIDTPESVKSGVDPQPYAVKSSDFTKKTLTGKKIKLVFEKDITDQYGRLLAHIILEDGTYYNALMVQNGYAIAGFYSPNTLLKEYFSELQSKAIENGKGFWQLPEDERPFIEDSKGKFVAAYKLKAKAA
ncbi:MAG TPA: thermonuclease family protein [Ruminiclostridium sp.]